MRRRQFLKNLSLGGKDNVPEGLVGDRPKITAGLEKYTTALDRRRAYHLLRRLSFAPTPEEVDQITGKTAEEALAIILGDGSVTPPAAPVKNWVDNPEEDPLSTGSPEIRAQIESRLKTGFGEFNNWWLGLMKADSVSAREKLTLFWSTIWCIEFTYDTLALIPPGLCYRNNQTLRKDRLGNYKDFVLDLTLDGAMLLYQSLQYSNRNIANENYMREMMELFTMGTGDIVTGDSNYTEGDIREGSKALTGWRTAPYLGGPHPKGYFETYFSPQDHIIDSKTFMGNTIPARDEDSNTEDLVKNEEVLGIINTMFEQRPMAIARFISEKIYRYFVYSNPGTVDLGIVDGMAQAFVNNDFDLKPVFELLLGSAHFFDEENIGIQFKRPPEFIVGLERMLGVDYSDTRNAVFDLEQVLYDPPNVGSWKGYRSWISTKTLPLRVKYTKEILALADDQALIDLAKKFASYEDAGTCSAAISEFFLPNAVDTGRVERYKQTLLLGAGTDEAGWPALINGNDPKAASGIRSLIEAFITAPDFQLC